MTQKEVLQVFRRLAFSQGFYGRLLRDLNQCTEDQKKEFLRQFEGCKSALDVIMKLEG